MARYRKVDPRIWNDERFRELSDDAKLAFLFLLTHPHMTSIGAMRATIPGLASEIGWDLERAAKAFAESFSKGMAKHDAVAAMVWLPKFIRYNGPENPNVLKAWGSALELLPECDLTREAIRSVAAFAKGLPKAFAEALPEPFAKGLPKTGAVAGAVAEKKSAGVAPTAPAAPSASLVPTEANPATKTNDSGDASSCTFEQFISRCRARGEDEIPEDHPVMRRADKVGIPHDLIELAWVHFAQDHRKGGVRSRARYVDWRAVFSKAVRENWYRLWWINDAQKCEVTSVGRQARLEHQPARGTA